jgi:hopanoid biosynthesis associated radical SAM protein HpnH
MGTPIELGVRMAGYVYKNILSGRKRFPIVMMLEPLETCNLKCKGCGRVREYHDTVISSNKMVSVEKCLQVVEEAGAPIVSIAGGEPLIHPQIDEIVSGIIAQKRFVFLCTNGLLMERAMKKIKPSKYFSWVVHLEGMRETHDYWVDRAGVWDKAFSAAEHAIKEGYRVCTNTTVYKNSDVEDIGELFHTLTNDGIEGLMISAGFPYESVSEADIFLDRQQSIDTFRKVLDTSNGYRFYNNPLYLQFLRGEREYSCKAWTNPTYTPLGWRKPCYLIADEHTDSLDEILDPALWEKYGTGKDPRCATCMMHSGYEGGIVQGAMSNPREMLALINGYLHKGRKKSAV